LKMHGKALLCLFIAQRKMLVLACIIVDGKSNGKSTLSVFIACNLFISCNVTIFSMQIGMS